MKLDLHWTRQLSFFLEEHKFLFHFFLIYALIDEVLSSSSNEVERHLEKGLELLSRGQFGDALSHYHAAIEGDPKNYMTYFKRATVYLAIGKPKAALDDLNEVLELNSEFLPARARRGSLYLKLGRVDEAHIDLEYVLREDPNNLEVLSDYSLIESIKIDLHHLDIFIQENKAFEAIDLLTKLIPIMSYNSKLRELRASFFETVGDIKNAIVDLTLSTKMNNDDTNGYLKLSLLHYKIGEVEESLQKIRECLKLNPDDKNCMTHYKKSKLLFGHLKAINDYSQQEQFEDCVKRSDSALKVETDVVNILHFVLAKKCHCANKANSADAIEICDKALKLDPHDLNVLCDKAEIYLNNDDLKNAEESYQKVLQIDSHFTRAQEGLKKVQNVSKLKNKKDYYKILEVRRTATKREILKQYRKLAAKWHPDNFPDEKEKKNAEKLFIDIARAKEVLTDEEKRKKFDMGIDPLDPEENRSRDDGFPFHFHDSPFVFRFNFN